MTPLFIVGAVFAVTVLAGALRRRREGTWRPHHRLPVLVAVVASLVLAATSSAPVDVRAMSSLPIHMVAHVVVMFLVPMAFVWSGVGCQLEMVMPEVIRRPLRRAWSRWAWRGDRSLLASTVILNAVMVASHLPAVFNDAMSHPAVMNWIVEPTFLLSGWWFFGGLISAPGYPVPTRLSRQLLAVVFTMGEMLILAMSMSIFTKTAWYQMSDAMGPMTMSFSSQQLAAAILWICGDFWGVPLVVVIFRRLIDRDGSLLAALDRRVRNV